MTVNHYMMVISASLHLNCLHSFGQRY
ncbi:hypothetical protein Golax_016988 [Gossypium laxum]|uniref:Uncharacterized protein n=7 Tax=Gossypium TaxID=3633 RepID=A0A7J8L9N3_9ROSI|nr:hypothetical protein [Gossypium lobatum]MBA0704749.1 hypothetical protein [Gossypium laxum]